MRMADENTVSAGPNKGLEVGSPKENLEVSVQVGGLQEQKFLSNLHVKSRFFEDVRFQNWTAFLTYFFDPEKCPFPTRPVRVLKFSGEAKNLVFHKASYDGTFTSSALQKSSKKLLQPKRKKRVQTSEEVQLQNCYHGRLPIKAAKFRDLLHLSQFLERDEAKQFYRSLNQVEPPEDDEEDNDEFIDDPPIDVDPDGE
ncbi:hypothetical protein GE061_013321 [Apolygus lucorum]|uniref:Uncharacterized protein n=1 Tax=Apolygus lucorum TaxID=248454 RepID=A0A8S9XPQ6_APOLU|nr:hypothetical protein GE061_013321 [Apolygus lucorum]